MRIERLALDYRRKGNPHFVCNATFCKERFDFAQQPRTDVLKKYKKNNSMPSEVSVIGTGLNYMSRGSLLRSGSGIFAVF